MLSIRNTPKTKWQRRKKKIRIQGWGCGQGRYQTSRDCYVVWKDPFSDFGLYLPREAYSPHWNENDNEHISYQNLRVVSKAIFRGKCIAFMPSILKDIRLKQIELLIQYKFWKYKEQLNGIKNTKAQIKSKIEKSILELDKHRQITF